MDNETKYTRDSPSSDTQQEPRQPEWGSVVFHLPGLRNAPPLGGGCCAMTAEDAVRSELDSWPTITVTHLDLDAERVTCRIDPTGEDQVEDAAEALRDLGLHHVTILRVS